ncbi:unnamed protein product [Urochloa humidicola]
MATPHRTRTRLVRTPAPRLRKGEGAAAGGRCLCRSPPLVPAACIATTGSSPSPTDPRRTRSPTAPARVDSCSCWLRSRCGHQTVKGTSKSSPSLEVLLGESTEVQISDLEELPVRVAYFQSDLGP